MNLIASIVVATLIVSATSVVTSGSAEARGKADWLEIANACNAKYGLHDGSGRAAKAELDCIDYYQTHGRMPPTSGAAARFSDARNDWIQTLCSGVAGRVSLNSSFQTYDSCLAWAKFVGLSQGDAKHLAAIYGIARN
jgi:hypothetical protein